MEEMCLSKDRSLSNRTPRFPKCEVGERMEERKAMETEENFRRCWGVPMRRNSVFDGLMERRLEEEEEFVVVGGDKNGHVGAKADGYEGVHGGKGYGERSTEGEMLLEFADAMKFV